MLATNMEIRFLDYTKPKKSDYCRKLTQLLRHSYWFFFVFLSLLFYTSISPFVDDTLVFALKLSHTHTFPDCLFVAFHSRLSCFALALSASLSFLTRFIFSLPGWLYNQTQQELISVCCCSASAAMRHHCWLLPSICSLHTHTHTQKKPNTGTKHGQTCASTTHTHRYRCTYEDKLNKRCVYKTHTHTLMHAHT